VALIWIKVCWVRWSYNCSLEGSASALTWAETDEMEERMNREDVFYCLR